MIRSYISGFALAIVIYAILFLFLSLGGPV